MNTQIDKGLGLLEVILGTGALAGISGAAELTLGIPVLNTLILHKKTKDIWKYISITDSLLMSVLNILKEMNNLDASKKTELDKKINDIETMISKYLKGAKMETGHPDESISDWTNKTLTLIEEEEQKRANKTDHTEKVTNFISKIKSAVKQSRSLHKKPTPVRKLTKGEVVTFKNPARLSTEGGSHKKQKRKKTKTIKKTINRKKLNTRKKTYTRKKKKK